MLALSDTAASLMNSQNPVYVKRVELCRRAWIYRSNVGGITTGSFAMAETGYGLIPVLDLTRELVELTPVSWKFDTETYGKWGRSNCTATFKNQQHQWDLNINTGYFAGFTRAVNILPKLHGSKVRIVVGVKLPNSAEESEYIYTGYITSDPTYYPDNKTVQVLLTDHMSAFSLKSAEDISVMVSNELLGGDSGTEFITAHYATGIITSVRKGLTGAGVSGATELTLGKEYSVSQLSEYNSGAKITLNEALLAGYSLWVSYKYWYTDKPLEWVVEQLCALCGITSTAISPAAFESDIKNTWAQATAAEFNNGTDWYTDHSSGDVLLYSGFPVATGYSWETIESSNISWDLRPTFPELYTAAERISAAPTLPAGNPDRSARWASARSGSGAAYGTWQFNCDAGALYGVVTVPHYFHFVSNTGNRSNTTGYCLKVEFYSPATNTLRFTLYRANAGTLTQLWSADYNATRQPWGNAFVYLRFRVSRDANGVFRLFVLHGASGQWTSFGAIATDNSITTSAYAIAAFYFPAWSTTGYPIATFQAMCCDGQAATGTGLYWPSGIYTSPAIDGTASFKAWGKVTVAASSPSGTATVLQLRHSADNASWSDWSAVDGTGAILATERYIQIRLLLYGTTAQDATPTMTDWNVTYYTSQTLLRVVNMTGLKCDAALEKLAEMCAYEIGFGGSDTFLFRPRTSTTMEAAVFDASNIRAIVSQEPGFDRIYNRVTVTFGDYSKTVDSVTQGEAAPTSMDLYGTKELTVSSDNFLPADGVDLAYSIAPTLYKHLAGGPRMRLQVKTRFFMHLELGDKVKMLFSGGDYFPLWRWGDRTKAYGQSMPYWDVALAMVRLPLYGRYFRIEGIELDLENWQTTFDLVEVI